MLSEGPDLRALYACDKKPPGTASKLFAVMLQGSRFRSRKRLLSCLVYCGCERDNYTSTLGMFGRALEELMRSNFRRTVFNGMSFLSLLRAAAVAILLLGLAPPPAGAQPAPMTQTTAHVFLMRGVLNIFSLGMDEIAAKLQQQGIKASVHNHVLWASVADDAAAEYRSGRINTVILVGHSSGATVLPDMVVGRYVNLYVANGAGKPVQKTNGFRGSLENVDVEAVPGVSHLTIDKNQIIQQKVIATIDSVVFSAPRRPSVAEAPVVASSKRGASAAPY
jgi:hypothetical protein